MTISKRTKFFLGHLSCSLLIGLIVMSLVFFVWYPAPLAHAEGVDKIFLMMLVIDVTIGPLLTFLVYKEGKKTLKMDLSVIILLQVLALAYGAYTIAQTRPVWIVQSGSLFQLVRANAIDQQDQEDASPAYQHNGWLQPQWVAVNDADSRYDFYGEPALVPNLYGDLKLAQPRITKYAQPLQRLNKFNAAEQVQTILQKHPEANAWMPLRTADLGVVVLVHREQGRIIAVVNLRPWRE